MMQDERYLIQKLKHKSAKGKLVERRGRKVTGLKGTPYDSGIAR
jgi:hypothetical protein